MLEYTLTVSGSPVCLHPGGAGAKDGNKSFYGHLEVESRAPDEPSEMSSGRRATFSFTAPFKKVIFLEKAKTRNVDMAIRF